MKTAARFLRENLASLALLLCELAAGIFLLISPSMFTSGILILFGLILAASGLISCISYFRKSAEEAAKGQQLCIGLIGLISGCFFVFNSRWFLRHISSSSALYGTAILFAGMIKVQWIVNSLRLKKKDWVWALIDAACSIAFSIFILLNPFKNNNILWIFTAISLIIIGALDIAYLVILIKHKKTNLFSS